MSKNVILVNDNDEAIGVMEKMMAHKLGRLHRAFSVFIFNDNGEMLIHKRANGKYHSGGLWTNACCSHPRENETVESAAHRRLIEEMGFDTALKEKFSFIYRAEVGQGLTEHEYDHVFVGNYSATVTPNSDEVEDWKYISIEKLRRDVKSNPLHFTAWFKVALSEVLDHLS